MTISVTLLLASLLLLPFSWLLLHFLSASSVKKNTNSCHGRRIPSPPAFPIIGHYHLLKKPLHRSLASLARRHCGGTGLLLLRFGARPVLLVSSPAVADECFTLHDAALADRPSLASRRLLTAGDGDGSDCPAISTASYGPLWRHLRRLATVHALCAHRLIATAAARDAEARAVAAKLWRATAAGAGHGGGGGKVVSVKATAYEFVVNVIMAMVAGERMPEGKVLEFKAMTEAAFAAAGAANRLDFLPALRMLDFGRTRRRLAGIAEARRQFGQSLVDDYRRRHAAAGETTTSTRTVIGDLLREQERAPESHGDDVIRTVCLSLLQAGTDTSSCTIEWAMALLLNNPPVLRKATTEMDAVVSASRLFQESDLDSLPYLRCIILETLRLYPLAPHLVPHEASRDLVVAGHAIAKGTMVLVDVYSMQRDPDTWPEEPEKFVPERFMDGGRKKQSGGADDKAVGWMMPFGMGRRKCPGEGLALRTVVVALGVMVQCFEWGRVGEEEVDMSEGSGLTMPMVVPLVAMCRPRPEMEPVLKTL